MHWMTRLPLWLLAALASAGLLIGCATVEPERAASRSYFDNIVIKGRFSVSYEHQGQPQSAQGRFHWAQRGQYLDIDLLSPFGQTLARISVTPGLATIAQSGRETRHAPDAEALTAQMLGWSLPVNGLRDWLQAYTRKTEGMVPVAAPGSTQSFQANGWRVQYVSWQQDDGPAHPRRIDLARSDADSTALAMRLVIDSWEPR